MTPADDEYIKEVIRRALVPILNRLTELERQVNPGKAANPKQNEPAIPKKKKRLPGPVINDRAEKRRRQEEG